MTGSAPQYRLTRLVYKSNSESLPRKAGGFPTPDRGAIRPLWNKGIEIPGFPLRLDASRVQERGFVSHAHADHFARHREIWCSEATAALLRVRYSVAEERLRPLAFGQTEELDGWQVTLVPAGHTLGSAMIHLRSPEGVTLLYTGDFKTRPSLASEACEPMAADVLIMETTFGLPRYVFPPREELLRQIVAFIEAAEAAGEAPILLGYSFGKAQEILCILQAMGKSVMVHHTIKKMNAVYEQWMPGFTDHSLLFDAKKIAGHVLVVPPNVVRGKEVQAIKKRRIAMMSGWAMMSGAQYRYRSQTVLPLSDHADYPDSLGFVEAVNPSAIYTLHGFSREFAADLRRLGREAWSIHGNDQLDLFGWQPGGLNDDAADTP